MDREQLWKAALGQLELKISQGNFLTWFRDTNITQLNKGTAIIETPSAFAHEWLSRKYRKDIMEALKELDNSIMTVRFTIRSQNNTARSFRNRGSRIVAQKTKKEEAKEEQPQPSPVQAIGSLVRSRTLNPKYTFDSYVIGANNEVAHAASKAVANNPGESYNPLFIYGGVGLGKTHLMHAIGNAISQTSPETKIVCVSAEKFLNEFVQGIKERNLHSFKQRYRSADILMIDDVQFLAGKIKCQEELFHTYNALHGQNKQIILSSDRAPKAISTFEERLKSRLAGGMLVDIQQPDYETRLAIIQEKADKSSANIHPESLEFIAKNVQKNVRELEGALNRVIAHCELNNQEGTLEYTEKVLAAILEQSSKRTLEPQKIVEAVSSYYNTTIDELCGKRRKQEIVRPRQVAMYLLRKENNSSFPAIGQQFGGRDHTTAMHACEKIGKLLEHDDELVQDINFIRERLYA